MGTYSTDTERGPKGCPSNLILTTSPEVGSWWEQHTEQVLLFLFYILLFLKTSLIKSMHRFYGLKSWNAYSKDLGIYKVSLLFSRFSVKPSGGQDMVTKLHTPWGRGGGNWYSRHGGHASPRCYQKAENTAQTQFCFWELLLKVWFQKETQIHEQAPTSLHLLENEMRNLNIQL